MEARGPHKDMDIFLEVPRARIGILGLDFFGPGGRFRYFQGFSTGRPRGLGGRAAGTLAEGPRASRRGPLRWGGPGPPTDGPPVSCPVSTGGFKPGFMGGLGRLVFRSWFHARFHARFHGA